MPYIEGLKIAHKNHTTYYRTLLASNSKRLKRDKNNAIKQEASQALRSFFEQVDVANRTYPELNYVPLIKQLNGITAEHTNLNTHAPLITKKNQKAKAKKEAIANA